jgi:hypothetical protein
MRAIVAIEAVMNRAPPTVGQTGESQRITVT